MPPLHPQCPCARERFFQLRRLAPALCREGAARLAPRACSLRFAAAGSETVSQVVVEVVVAVEKEALFLTVVQ